MLTLERICEKLTRHRFRKKYDVKNLSGQRWCRCRLCGKHYWEGREDERM